MNVVEGASCVCETFRVCWSTQTGIQDLNTKGPVAKVREAKKSSNIRSWDCGRERMSVVHGVKIQSTVPILLMTSFVPDMGPLLKVSLN